MNSSASLTSKSLVAPSSSILVGRSDDDDANHRNRDNNDGRFPSSINHTKKPPQPPLLTSIDSTNVASTGTFHSLLKTSENMLQGSQQCDHLMHVVHSHNNNDFHYGSPLGDDRMNDTKMPPLSPRPPPLPLAFFTIDEPKMKSDNFTSPVAIQKVPPKKTIMMSLGQRILRQRAPSTIMDATDTIGASPTANVENRLNAKIQGGRLLATFSESVPVESVSTKTFAFAGENPFQQCT